MNIFLLLPILIPLVTAIFTLLFHRRVIAQRVIGMVGAAALLGASVALLTSVWTNGIQAGQFGNWPAPFGITFVADLLSAIMVVMAGIMGFAVAIYSLVTIDVRREIFGYSALFHVLLLGVCGAFLTGDVFNLYVWFEVLLMASFVLLALGSEQGQLEGAIKYVTLNLISSALFLAAVGILYAEAGTLNMADLARRLPQLQQQGLITTLAMLFLVAFGIKAAVFPLFFWLPASYHTPPAATSAIFAGLLTKVGVYALIRVFTLLFVGDVGYTHTIILVIAGLSMITGVLGAVAQNEIRRILSFLIVSHIGFAIMGLGLYSSFGLAGTVFYIIEDITVLTALFLLAGVIRRLGGTEHLQYLGGLYEKAPLIALLFFIPALSLSGIPPLSGFFAKLALLRAALEVGQYTIVAVALVSSLLTLFVMTRIWTETFWKAQPRRVSIATAGSAPARRDLIVMLVPVGGLIGMIIALGVFAGPILELTTAAAEQLLDSSKYVQVVLGDTR